MKKLLFLASAFAALTFTSCKKDDKPDGGTGGGGAKLLKKMTEKTNNNVTTVYNFSYDANKRLVSVISSDNTEKTFFTYDGNGNLVKIDETEEDFHNIYNYTYNNNVPVSATFKSWERTPGQPDELIEDDVLTYTVTNQQVSKIHLEMTMDGDEEDFNLSYGNNGNLQRVDAVTNQYTATFGFGSKKPIFPPVTKWILDQAGFSMLFASKNELLSIAFDFPGTQFDKTVTTTYTYDSDGYALTSNNGTSQTTYEYQ